MASDRASKSRMTTYQNTFYSAEDVQTYGIPRPGEDHRTPFQIDRDRILFSYAFRRLQSKTQVFQPGEYDFYRTRLTHSIEVARIARSICEHLNGNDDNLQPGEHFIDPDLVEAIGLAHDIGHPPFGHTGERVLHQLMEDKGGFEGNAQTLRILTELIYERENETCGMQPTRALLDGVLKYKVTAAEGLAEKGSPMRKHFLYDEQKAVRDFVFKDMTDSSVLPKTISTWNQFRSVECQIMDWSDDVAYSLHDIIDGIKAGFLSVDRIEKWAEGQKLSAAQSSILETLFTWIKKGNLEARFSRKIGEFIYAAQLCQAEHPLPRRAYTLQINEEQRQESALYKKIAVDLVFTSVPLHRIEFRESQMVKKLFHLLTENYRSSHPKNLLPPISHQKLIHIAEERVFYRNLVDVIADLTDLGARQLLQEISL